MEDNKIVQLYLERNESAIERTAEKYGSYCNSVAMNILGCREDACECVNDAYLKTWNTIPPHRPERLSTFLGKIVRNLSFNKYKMNHTAKRGGGETALLLNELEECIPDDSFNRETDRKELSEAINSFLAGLPEKQRNMFVCRYWYADSVGSIARQFGEKENSVSVTLGRLRKKLYTHLKERGIEV